MAPQCDVVIVVGSPNSSNSNRLREVARNRGVPAYMVDRADELRPEWIAGKQRVGVTAGASAPEVLVQRGDRAPRRSSARAACASSTGVVENVTFPLPQGLGRRTPIAKAARKSAPQRPEPRGPPASPALHARSARNDMPASATNVAAASAAASAGDRARGAPDSLSARTSAFGEVERQQQRQPLPRARAAARDAGHEERQRQRLQRQPRVRPAAAARAASPTAIRAAPARRAGDRDARAPSAPAARPRRQPTATNS